ncbi:MAG: hypothetical protein A2X48_13335 [Lentisphaerae bacterium GWF2_49_21]|nr:MAG: hypothetical protein A2X48_13335 [Lentisphaerae bacterium GWF2_49_21]
MRKNIPVDFSNVEIRDSFWSPRLDTNRKNTIPTVYAWSEKTGRIDAWKWKPGMKNKPHHFWDSDVAKWIEAAAYSLEKNPDKNLERQIDHVVDLMGAAQLKDGYLNSFYIKLHPKKRWTNLRDMHELYCAGHLIEGAVAYFTATGKRKFLDIMLKYVDHISRTFGRKPGQKRGYCGHEEVELALLKLYNLTGDKKHLELAEYFINERGQKPNYFSIEAKKRGDTGHWAFFGGKENYDYYQAEKPVRQLDEALGHAVRAGYLYSAMASLAAETNDKALFETCKRLFDNILSKKMYITGGIGSKKHGEAFSYEYDLQNETAYAETCAAISLVFFSYRMLQLEQKSVYADVMERALYNGVMSGVSLDGKAFFYSNPLSAYPHPGNMLEEHVKPERQKWFGCSCCPSNVARLLASLGSYIYMKGEDEIRVNLFISSSASIDIKGNPVLVSQKTNYPWDGSVSLEVSPQTPAEFKVCVRIPGWCRKYSIKVKGANIKFSIVNGYAIIKRKWSSGEKIEINFEMPATLVEADPRLRHDCGKVAIQRGPIVYCAEEADNGKHLYDVAIDVTHPGFVVNSDNSILKGAVAIVANACRRKDAGWKGQLYRPCESKLEKFRLKAIPYFIWANRKPGEMAVWLNRG